MKNLYNKVKEMYSNIGKKIMNIVTIATLVLIVLLILGTIGLAFVLAEDFLMIVVGVLGGILSIVIVVLSLFPIYAFGQLVDDVHAMRKGEVKKGEYDDLPNL